MKKLFVGFVVASMFSGFSAFASMGSFESLVSEEQLLQQSQQEMNADEAGMTDGYSDESAVAVSGIAHGHGRVEIVCYARNARGRTFRGYGSQRRALDNCYASRSRHCYALGCEREFVRYGN